MKKFLLSTLLLAGIAWGAHAQQTIKSDKLDPFTDIELTGNLIVELTQAEQPAIEIQLNNTDISRLSWNVSGGVLSIRLRPGVNSGSSADIKISYSQLSRMKIAGANVAFKTPYQGLMLDMDMSAGAALGGMFEAQDVMLKITGTSAASLTGGVKYLTINASNRSKVNARELIAEDVNVNASSGAEVYVHGIDRIQITSDTGASVFYQGSPQIFRSTTRLMGTVNAIGK